MNKLPLVIAALTGTTLAPGAATAAAPVSWSYPPAVRGATIDDYHGTKVADPYRWLEDLDSPATQAWVAAENKLTFGFLATLPQRAKFQARLTQLWNFPRVGVPFKEGGRYFFSKNTGLQNQAVFFVQEKLDATPRVLIDPNTLAADGTVALSDAQVSPDGKWVAYATAAAGSDWNEVRVRSVDDGKDTTDLVQWMKFSGISWTRDNAGFFYSRYPAPKTAGNGETFSELADMKLYYHRLGTPQAEDRQILALQEDPKWMLNGGVTEDGRYLVVSIRRGTGVERLVRIADLGDPKAPRLDAPIVPLITTWDASFDVISNDGARLFVLTNADAPRRRVIAIDLAHPERANWKTLIPQGADVIESVDLIGGRFVVNSMHDASSRLAVFTKEGAPAGTIALPGIGTVAAVRGREDETEFFYNFTSFTTPATNFRHDVATNRGAVFQAPQVAFDPAAYETKQVFYTSKDGTRVPSFDV